MLLSDDFDSIFYTCHDLIDFRLNFVYWHLFDLGHLICLKVVLFVVVNKIVIFQQSFRASGVFLGLVNSYRAILVLDLTRGRHFAANAIHGVLFKRL